MDNLHQVATQADDYELTHKGSFYRQSNYPDPVNKTSGETRQEQGSGPGPLNPRDKNPTGTSRLPMI